MNIPEFGIESTWLFQLGFPVRRFDVTKSPTGLLNDFTWNLGSEYDVPPLHTLTPRAKSVPTRIAWHERGIFVQCEFTRFGIEESPFVGCKWNLFFNSRYSPDIQRGTIHCTSIGCSIYFSDEKSKIRTGVSGVGSISRSKEKPPVATGENVAWQSEWKQQDHWRFKVFVPANQLYGYNPIEFPELAFHYDIGFYGMHPKTLAHSVKMPTHENPSLWTKIRLVD